MCEFWKSAAENLKIDLLQTQKQLVASREELARLRECVSAPDSNGYWWMLDTHLPVRWDLVKVTGQKIVRVETQMEIQSPRCCSSWVKVHEPERT